MKVDISIVLIGLIKFTSSGGILNKTQNYRLDLVYVYY